MQRQGPTHLHHHFRHRWHGLQLCRGHVPAVQGKVEMLRQPPDNDGFYRPYILDTQHLLLLCILDWARIDRRVTFTVVHNWFKGTYGGLSLLLHFLQPRSIRSGRKVCVKQGVFLAIGPKTQGPKNSNSRILAPKLKDFLFENSTNRQV